MSLGLLLWVVALVSALVGLVLVLREHLITGGILIVSGLALGIASSEHLG
jgi:hypothetical protein